MITLFGATGYTGQKIAAVLAHSGLPFRLAGRSAERLQALAASLPTSTPPDWLVADVHQPDSLLPLLHDTRLLINCAGPYTDLGERVLSQAAMAGVHYLDVTNELGYRFKARSYHELARRSHAAVVPACGFEVALADCAAHLAAQPLLGANPTQPLDAIEIVYDLHGSGSSTGTRRSAIRSLATSWIRYEDGGWHGSIPGGQVRAFRLPTVSGPSKAIHALQFPSCESVTVPAHLPVQKISTWMSTTPGARYWAPVFVPLFARLARSIAGPLAVHLAGRGGLKDDQNRAKDRFTILVTARRGQQSNTLALVGSDVYGLTANIIVYYAQAMLQPDYACAGLLAPAQAVDPAGLIETACASWNVTRLPPHPSTSVYGSPPL